MKLEMKLLDCPILRETAAPVTDVSPELLNAMKEMANMMEEQKGVGLAAPQVGLPMRFFLMNCKLGSDKEPKIYVVINPEIIEKSDETKVMEEGCLSVLDNTNTPVFADVSRPKNITAVWNDEKGEQHKAKLGGYAARIFQHEYDHLDGILFIDYLSPVKREMVRRKVKKKK